MGQEKVDRTKIKISSKWAREERNALIAMLDGEIAKLDAEEKDLRKTILYEAPCFEDIARKQAGLDELRVYARVMSPGFLEINRGNYRDYVRP